MNSRRAFYIISLASLLTLSWTPGFASPTKTYRIEKIVIKGNKKTTDSTVRLHLQFKELQLYDEQKLKDSRFKLLVTGFFTDVDFRLRRGSKPGWAIVQVIVKERGTIIIDDLYLGSSHRTMIWAGLALTEKNFLGRGFNLSAAGVFSRRQQGYRLSFSDPMFVGKPLLFGVTLLYNNAVDYLFGPNRTIVNGKEKDFGTIEYRRLGGRIGFGFRIGNYTRLFLSYRFEGIEATLPESLLEKVQLDFQGTDHSYTRRLNVEIKRGRSYLSALQFNFRYQSLNSPILPSNGLRLDINAEVGHSIFGSSYDYARFTVQYDHYWKLPWKHVISLHIFGGFIIGSTPFFNQFFIGDLSDLVPRRDLELNFTSRKNPNILTSTLDEKRYEDIAGRVALGYSIPLYRGGRRLYKADFFFNIGLIALTDSSEVTIRTARDKRPFPLDLTFNLGFRFDTPVGVFAVSFSNLLGVIEY